MKCEDIQKELKAFLDNDIDDQKKSEIKGHLNQCPNCTRDLERQKKLSEVLRSWKGIEPSTNSYEKLEARIESNESFLGKVFTYSFGKKAAFRFAEVVVIVGITLVISQWIGKPQQRKRDDLNTINLYLTAHQGAVLKTVSDELSPEIGTRISARTEDFMYYEHIDRFARYTRPGVIFRGPSKSQRETPMPEIPSISKGEILDLTQARIAVDFEPAAPIRLYPGYILDGVRKIEDYNSLHLIYTNGIHTLSLFEQSLDGKNMLGAQDFREYAVYRSNRSAQDMEKTLDKSTILAWRNGAVSFVLIGNEEMSRLMEIAQAVSAVNKENHGILE
ncbi:MAG: zf-HC2 domain-containing protein [Candidatus Aminicenantaceae bacterium]